jgi:hypothetical protein
VVTNDSSLIDLAASCLTTFLRRAPVSLSKARGTAISRTSGIFRPVYFRYRPYVGACRRMSGHRAVASAAGTTPSACTGMVVPRSSTTADGSARRLWNQFGLPGRPLVGRHHDEIPQAVTKSLHQNAAVSPRTPAVSGEEQHLVSARAQPPAGTPEQKSATGAQPFITNLLNAEGDAGL